MEDLTSLLISFQTMIPFVDSLRSMTEIQWFSPLQPGRWSTCAVIGHIMLWDRHFMNGAIRPIAFNTSLTLNYSDFDFFNQHAAEYAATIPQNLLIEACTSQRQQLVDLIQSMSAAQLTAIYTDGDGKPFTMEGYLIDFIGHDHHHKLQIEHYLSA